MQNKMFFSLLLAMLALVLTACEGKNGAAGNNGAPGRQGESGVMGANGSDGANGVDGANGADGANGQDGMNGVNGQDGVDGLCANAERLTLTGITDFPAELIEGTTVDSVAVDSNVDPSRTLRLSFSGNLAGLTFVDNGNNTFGIVADQGSATTQSALFSIVATDGCTTDTLSFTVNGIGAGGTSFTFIHLIDGAVGDLWVSKGDEVVGLAADGTTSMTVAPSIIPPGQYAFSVYASNPLAMGPADYDEGALLGTSDIIELGVRENHTLFVYPDVDGNPVFQHFANDVTAPADEANFAANVSHFANAAGQVDILDADTGAIVLENVDFGASSGRVELPAATYNLGLDVDNDGMSDVVFDPITAPAGAITNIFAAVVGGEVVLGVLILDAQMPTLLTISQVVPALGNDGAGVAQANGTLIESFPYPTADTYIGYGNNEDLSVNVTEFSVPGASQLQVSLRFDVEASYDFLVAIDAMGGQIAEYTGQDTAVIVVDADTVSFGFLSDTSVSTGSPSMLGYEPMGFQVEGITYE
jgi:hypothetical protein